MFLFPTGKIEELYKNLQEKNSETYIKRSKLVIKMIIIIIIIIIMIIIIQVIYQ